MVATRLKSVLHCSIKTNMTVHSTQLGTSDREQCRHYIAIDEAEELEMLKSVGVESLEALYQHIPDEFRFATPPELEEELDRDALREALKRLSERNPAQMSLIGDGLPDYAIHPIVDEVLKIRELSTAYTPYQPERSQGTLIAQWIYQCTMSALTGFEAINASLYDRSTAIFEACLTAFRVEKGKTKALIASGIYPGDKAVIETHFRGTDHQFAWIPYDRESGHLDLEYLRATLEREADSVAVVCFPQVNSLGYPEDVDAVTRLCESHRCRTVGIVDPMHLVENGLKPPSTWGQEGVDFVVGEAQHFAFNPCFGGPGLGLFGVRTDEKRKNFVRNTPGRYIGKAKDVSGRDCFVAVMSAREQHIRRDRATSNICSNQAFIALLAGAAILGYGETGLKQKLATARKNAENGKTLILQNPAYRLAYPGNAFLNELTFEYNGSVAELLESASQAGIQLGVDVSGRVEGDTRQLLKVSFHDKDIDWELLQRFLSVESRNTEEVTAISPNLIRSEKPGLPDLEFETLCSYYRKLGELNVSPDNGIYPLGSCTMKYNPEINEWAAALPGFQSIHPQATASAAQGCLEVLWEIQEWFRKITGLAGLTTQPVAGAQGELTGIKLFQAYHEDHDQSHRDIVFIPSTSHGTNFATTVMAGYSAGRRGRKDAGVVALKTDALGGIDLEDFEAKLAIYGERLVGIMITNPNTCGVFESNFRTIADRVHEVGGLVYMDGANMNAIAGWIDLAALGVDAVHNNIHKTWSIPHGGGGPGDGFVAVSERLLDYLPGYQIEKDGQQFKAVKPSKSIGSFHRHWGNFNHKIRCLTYLKALGKEGVPRMSAIAVLSARYLFSQLLEHFDEIPAGSAVTPRMHEFVLSFRQEFWKLAEEAGVAKTAVMPGFGKLFLDFGYHAPTVAFPEPYGVMIEPTESYSKTELDRFCEVAVKILEVIRNRPEVLKEAPYFTPIDRVDEVLANRSPVLSDSISALPIIHENRIAPLKLLRMNPGEIVNLIANR